MDFIPLRTNGASQEQIEDVFQRLKKKEVIEASFEKYFQKLPNADFISDIEIGDMNTKKSVVRFKDDSFAVFDGVVKFKTILKKVK